MKTHNPPNSGFTLIELVVVTAISILLMLTVSAIFMTFLVGSAKTTLAQKIKVEGNRALSQIEFLLRNSRSLTTGCTAGLTSIDLEGFDGQTTTLTAKLDNSKYKIASTSALNGDFFLTSESSTLINDKITFDCVTGNSGVQHVTVTFSLQKGPNSSATSSDKENIVETFSSGVTLRN